jgi:hypothetical protein
MRQTGAVGNHGHVASYPFEAIPNKWRHSNQTVAIWTEKYLLDTPACRAFFTIIVQNKLNMP